MGLGGRQEEIGWVGMGGREAGGDRMGGDGRVVKADRHPYVTTTPQHRQEKTILALRNSEDNTRR